MSEGQTEACLVSDSVPSLSLSEQTLVKSQLLQEALGRAVVVPPLTAAVTLANLLDTRVSVGHENTDGFPNSRL